MGAHGLFNDGSRGRRRHRVILTAVCIAWSAATASVAAWAFLRSKRAGEGGRAPRSRFLLLRPCAGNEPGLARALRSSAEAGHAASLRFLVGSSTDAAAPVAGDVAVALSSEVADAALVVTSADAPNRKADQLARALAAEREDHSIVVVADSDVVLSAALVSELILPIEDGRADAVWAPPVEAAGTTVGDAASRALLDASLHAFALLSALDPDGMVGKLFAVRRRELDRAGGFAAMTGCLGEDMELARRLRAGGARIEVTRAPAPSLAGGRTWSAVVGRYARWIAVIRAQRPALLATYPLILAATPLQMLVAFAAAFFDGPRALLALAAVLGARLATAMAARWRSGRGKGGLVFAPFAADVVLLAAFVRAVSTRRIEWRGVPLRIGRGGVLLPVDP